MTTSTTIKTESTPLNRYSSIPDDKDQHLVQTPYGRGLVLRTRRSDDGKVVVGRDIQLLDWKSSSHDVAANPKHKYKPKKPCMLYSPMDFPSVPPKVGDDVVVTVMGRGRVLAIKNETKMAKVMLSSWRLAERNRVTCYLPVHELQVVQPKKLFQMSVHERVEFAQECKAIAAKSFAKKDYSAARIKYQEAVDAVRYVHHTPESDNFIRADLLVVMITCCNNAAMCASHQQEKPETKNSESVFFQSSHWLEVIQLGKQATSLLDALYENRGKRIHSVLNRSMSDTKLFGEWRVKSYWLQARGHAAIGEYDKALELCKSAHEIIAEYTALSESKNNSNNNIIDMGSVKNLKAQGKEIKRLFTACKERKQRQLQKEKQRAVAMFGGSAGAASSSPAKTDEVKEVKKSKKVSFAEKDEYAKVGRFTGRVVKGDGGRHLDPDEDDDDDDGYDEAWYSKHQELLIMVAGLGLLSFAAARFFGGRRK